MILTDNIIILKKMFPELWERIKKFEEQDMGKDIQIIPAKTGVPNIIVKTDREISLHSKYDPQNEAAGFVNGFNAEDMEKYSHVFFYGLGLGYHIFEMMKKYPDKSFSIYEPSPEVLCHFLSVQKLEELPLKKWKHFFVEFDNNDLAANLLRYTDTLQEETMFIVLPSYERAFENHYKRFNNEFINTIRNKKRGIATNWAYEKRWTVNSMVNLEEVLNTPNILRDFNRDIFLNKPALLVAAGPSLDEEFENLRYIKENGLSYIFAVGSAMKSLVKKNIFPDAVCAYDPNYQQQAIFSGLEQADMEQIPFIFGSSVGFETVKNYPGPKAHMIVSQDTVAPFYIGEEICSKSMVSDAPSIAVVTLELLAKLGFNPIILVGQNLAFKGEKTYAQGIDHFEEKLLKDQVAKAEENQCIVENVYGEQVFTQEAYISMRKQMEHYISLFPCEVINTTKGGAKITGADFIPLEQLVKSRFKEKVRNDLWFSENKDLGYNKEYIKEKFFVMEKEHKEFFFLLQQVGKILDDIREKATAGKEEPINKLFSKLDKSMKKLKNNYYFRVFLQPMNRVRYDFLLKSIPDIRGEQEMIKRSQKVVESFGSFIYDCREDTQLIEPIYQSIQGFIQSFVEKNKKTN